MPMAPFMEKFPELGARETRSVKVPVGNPLPHGEYGFIELSCSLPATSSVSRTITRCFVPRWNQKAQTEPESSSIPGLAALPVDPSLRVVARKFQALLAVQSSPSSPDAQLVSCSVFVAGPCSDRFPPETSAILRYKNQLHPAIATLLRLPAFVIYGLDFAGGAGGCRACTSNRRTPSRKDQQRSNGPMFIGLFICTIYLSPS
jgi:hypothetical protein